MNKQGGYTAGLFKPGYYRVTKLFDPARIEIEGMWILRPHGVDENSVSSKDKVSNWLCEGNYIKVRPYFMYPNANIAADIWLGSIFINGSFSNYREESQSA